MFPNVSALLQQCIKRGHQFTHTQSFLKRESAAHEPSRAEQGRVDQVRSVGCGDDEYLLVRVTGLVHAVQFSQELRNNSGLQR